jgi:hypothetical protein
MNALSREKEEQESQKRGSARNAPNGRNEEAKRAEIGERSKM